MNALPFSSELLLAQVVEGFCPRQKACSCIPFLTNTTLRQTAVGEGGEDLKKKKKKKLPDELKLLSTHVQPEQALAFR